MKMKNKLKDIEIITKRLAQATALTVLCLVVLPSFVQTAEAQSCGDPGVTCDDDGNIIVDLDIIGVIGDPIDDPFDDPFFWPDPPGGGSGSGSGGGESGGGGSGSNGSYDPIVCNNLLQNSPNTPSNPLACVTDPGGAAQLNYSLFITNNLGNIIGGVSGAGCAGSLIDGCYWSLDFPYMTEQIARNTINIFGDAYFRSLDYLSSRNAIWYVLSATCSGTYYWSNQFNFGTQAERRDAYNSCIGSQADFLFSLAPSTTPAGQGWTGSLGYQFPWGTSISLNFDTSTSSANNWVANLLTEIRADRVCHSWYQALEDANCPNPTP